MIRPSLLRWSTAMTLVGALALAGCSEDAKSATEPEVKEGPLAKILEAVWGQDDPEETQRKQDEIENKIADCMAAEGFPYIPMKMTSSATFTQEDWEERNTKEWAAQNGYGIAGADEESEEAEPTEEPVDPNLEHTNSLSDSERDAYYAALWGETVELTEEEMEDYVDSWENNGCRGAAEHEVNGDGELYNDPRFEDIMTSIYEVYGETQNEPEVVAVAAKWADCMADAGYTGLATPSDAVQSMYDAYDEASGWATADENYTGPSAEVVAEFRKKEIATAVADFDCQEKVDWQAVNREVNIRLEEAFVKDNKVALDELVAAAQESGK